MINRKEKPKTKRREAGPVTYEKLFWLFLAGSVAGLLMEGVWCLVRSGRWESHVTTMYLPLCCIYGLGAAGCYAGCVALNGKPRWVKFLSFCFVGAAIELIVGYALEYGLGMRAWDYRSAPLNIGGHVSAAMTFLWGLLGTVFDLVLPNLERLLSKLDSNAWRIACIVLSVAVVLDFSFACTCIVRWKNRRDGIPPSNSVSRYIDDRYDDSFMSRRFCEWSFIDE